MKSRKQKSEELKSVRSKFPGSSITVFTTFSKAGEKGLSVAQMQQLKRSMRALESEYVVTKKTLIKRAVDGLTGDDINVYGMDGSVGLVIGKGDGYAVAKNLYDFSKKNPALHFWGAIFEGKFLDQDSFLEMAKLPSKEVLIGRLLGMLTYPMRGLAVAIDQIAKKQQTN